MAVKVIKVLVRDNYWYIGIYDDDDDRLTLVDSSCFTHVLVRRCLYKGWVGYIPEDAELIVEPEACKYHDIFRIGTNLYIVDRESKTTPHIEGLDRFYV